MSTSAPRASSSGKSSAESWNPHKYQQRAIKHLVGPRNAAALFLDPGMGKTSIVYASVKVLKAKHLARGALVVAPRRPAVSVWPGEHAKWAEFAGLSIGLLHGPKKDKVLLEKHDVYIMTYDGIRWLFGAPPPNYKLLPPEERAAAKAAYQAEQKVVAERLKLLMKNVDILVFDELTKMKNKQTGRHKSLGPHLGRFARRWGLTGSPAANGLENLFGQMYALDMGKAFGPYITHFRASFFDDKPKYRGDPYPLRVLKPGAESVIYARIAPSVLRLSAEDYLELPQEVHVPIKFDLPADVRLQYDEMHEKMLMSMPDGEVFTARAASAVSVKCRQITSGALYYDPVDPITGMPARGPRKWKVLHDEKLEMLEDLIEELAGQPLLVAYEFQHELERIKTRLGKDIAYIGSGVSDKRASELESAWNARELPHLFAHPASIGHGLNLQGSSAHHVLWFSGTWDYELYDQFIRRLKRQGSKAPRVFVYQFIARDTVDEAVYYDKKAKGRGQRSLLEALNRRK